MDGYKDETNTLGQQAVCFPIENICKPIDTVQERMVSAETTAFRLRAKGKVKRAPETTPKLSTDDNALHD